MKTMLVLALMGANEQQARTFLIGLGIAFLIVAAALAFGLQYWSKRHGFLGWFTRIVAVVVGGLVGTFSSLVMDAVPKSVQKAMPEFIIPLIILAFALAGAWLALRIVNLFGKREA